MKQNRAMAKSAATAPLSKKQKNKQYLKKFKVKFDIDQKAIDLRTMSENYTNGIIPLDDINTVINLHSSQPQTIHTYDPSDPANAALSPQFKYVEWNDLFLWPRFQRDVSPNHIDKILSDFDHSCVIVPTAIKVTINGKIHFCVWDGHHTLQVCRNRGYKKFPIWYIDIDAATDSQIADADFPLTTAGRVEYGIWLAGSNMVRINSKNKRKLSPYDEFMILLETGDARTLRINNILKKHSCVPVRNSGRPGAFTQIKSGIECYELRNEYGVATGEYFSRALRFHRKAWPMASLELEVFRPLSYLYHEASLQGITLDAAFDASLENLLITQYGDAESVQRELKESYWNAAHQNKGKGIMPDQDKRRVLSGIINLYNQKIGKILLPPADYRWTI